MFIYIKLLKLLLCNRRKSLPVDVDLRAVTPVPIIPPRAPRALWLEVELGDEPPPAPLPVLDKYCPIGICCFGEVPADWLNVGTFDARLNCLLGQFEIGLEPL